MASRGAVKVATLPQPVRCAIYTRKSTDHGLDKDFNSLDAQRDAAETYIRTRKPDGWISLSERYDDGGFTGANAERPALRRLLVDAESGKIDCIVVYRFDRFSRSLLHFMTMMDRLTELGVLFVSVSDQIDTSTSQGRLMERMLVSFAEFEREITAERIRDKVRAARRKGKWIGGNPPLGYDVAPGGGALVVNSAEAVKVRDIFSLYLEFGSLIPLTGELDRRGWRMKSWMTREGKQRGGANFRKNTLYNLLTNPAYTGRVQFEGELIEGEHERIVSDEIFDAVQAQLKRNGRRGGPNVRNKHHALLKGIAKCATCGCGMIHSFTKKGSRVYRYYVCRDAHTRGYAQCQTRSVPAGDLEDAVISHLRACAQHPQVLSESLKQIPDADPGELEAALKKFDPLWDQMSTWERETFIRTLISEVRYDGPNQMVTAIFRSEEIRSLCTGELL